MTFTSMKDIKKRAPRRTQEQKDGYAKIRIANEGKETLRETAKRAGIHESLLRRYVNDYKSRQKAPSESEITAMLVEEHQEAGTFEAEKVPVMIHFGNEEEFYVLEVEKPSTQMISKFEAAVKKQVIERLRIIIGLEVD